MPERRSLYHEYPDYRVDLDPDDRTWQVRIAGELIASTNRALIVRETNHGPITYLPLADLRAEWIEPTDHTSFCPFKGTASYWTVRVGKQVFENVVWGYPDPFEEVAGLAGFVAFYSDRVDWEIGEVGRV